MKQVPVYWQRAKYPSARPLGENNTLLTGGSKHIALSQHAAESSMVLVKNNGILPFPKGKKLAVLGIAQVDYVKGGTGSGAVWAAFSKSVLDGLRLREQAGDIALFAPLSEYYEKDMEAQVEYTIAHPKAGRRFSAEVQAIPGDITGKGEEHTPPEALLREAAAYTDTAVFVISRCAGEFDDRYPVKGDYYLSDGEAATLEAAKKHFAHLVVLINSGGMMEAGWLRDAAVEAVLYMYTPGMMGGLAAADILCGKVNPSGHLPDTVAADYKDYPSSEGFQESPYYVNYTDDIFVGYRYFETIPGAAEKVVFPFGFGLSYTTFSVDTESAKLCDDAICLSVRVKNTGSRAGREVVQVYYGAPQGKLGKAARSLVTFAKTKELAPGEEQVLSLTFKSSAMASYDDTGLLQKSAWLLEQGEYPIYVGTDVRSAEKVFSYTEEKAFRVTEQLTQCLPATALPKKLKADGTYEALEILPPHLAVYEKRSAPETKAPAGAWRLENVLQGMLTLEEFISTLSIDEQIALTCGVPNTGCAQTMGFGGIAAKGIPAIMTTDGPSGVRVKLQTGVETTCFPSPAARACSWDPELEKEITSALALEVKENNLYCWLAPALNIHRAALCGRNFEYYSEDPILTAVMATAAVNGCQSQRVPACPKHFACNNKEELRKESDSRVTERAIREIYIKAFELCIKESHPKTLMSSYNLINGIRASESYELLTTILRKEWGFDGFVYTDWNGHGNHAKEIMAGNDLKMSVGTPVTVRKCYSEGYLSTGELYDAVRNILKVILWFEEETPDSSK